MLNGIYGRKIGMTQVFSDDNNKVIPVTVFDVSGCYVLQKKTKDLDGYNSYQVGFLRKKYKNQFSLDFIKNKKKYFEKIAEISFSDIANNIEVNDNLEIGSTVDFSKTIAQDEAVDLVSFTIGRGFTGVVKRYNFSGRPASHGHQGGDIPGSVGFLHTQGKIIKGKKLPGRMGVRRKTMKGLKVVKILIQDQLVLIKGSCAGKSGVYVFIKKYV